MIFSFSHFFAKWFFGWIYLEFRICFFKTHIVITAVLNFKIVDYFFSFILPTIVFC